MIKKCVGWFFGLAAAFAVFQQPVLAANCAAEKYVATAGLAITVAARSGSPEEFANVTGQYTDIGEIAMFALGKHRSKLPDAMRTEYVALTKDFIGRFMAEHAARFNGEGVKIVECRERSNKLYVTARLLEGKLVKFRLIYAGQKFIIEDLNVAGIWLAQQLRSTFVDVISKNKGDINALINYLRA